MKNELPMGALTRDECSALKADPAARDQVIWYVVSWRKQPIRGEVKNLAMNLLPPTRYFRNFWFALAYNLKLTKKGWRNV